MAEICVKNLTSFRQQPIRRREPVVVVNGGSLGDVNPGILIWPAGGDTANLSANRAPFRFFIFCHLDLGSAGGLWPSVCHPRLQDGAAGEQDCQHVCGRHVVIPCVIPSALSPFRGRERRSPGERRRVCERQTDRQTGRQAHRQTHGQTH